MIMTSIKIAAVIVVPALIVAAIFFSIAAQYDRLGEE
jgi:hypothetical protein